MKISEDSVELLSLFGKFALANLCKDPVLEKKYGLELTKFILNNQQLKVNLKKDPGDKSTKKEA